MQNSISKSTEKLCQEGNAANLNTEGHFVT